MIGDAVVIEHDLFGIAARLRSIDDGYFVVYNRKQGSYEVHNRFQRGSTFALRVPYPCLDARTETLVRRTRVENAEKLLENARLARRESARAADGIAAMLA